MELSSPTLSLERAEKAVKLSPKDSLITISTSDETFIGQSLQALISVEPADPSVITGQQKLTLQVLFVKQKIAGEVTVEEKDNKLPQDIALEISEMSIPGITCSAADAKWGFTFPKIKGVDDDDIITFSLLSQSEAGLLSFRQEFSQVKVS